LPIVEWRRRYYEGTLKHERGFPMDGDRGDKRLSSYNNDGFENWYSITGG
jgi:hypothetical protein